MSIWEKETKTSFKNKDIKSYLITLLNNKNAILSSIKAGYTGQMNELEIAYSSNYFFEKITYLILCDYIIDFFSQNLIKQI